MHVVVIDLVPALLSWEGRDRSAEPIVAPNAAGALEHLSSHFGLTGVADAGYTAEQLRNHLEREHLAVYFESIGSVAEYGPRLTPRVVRRLTAPMKLPVRDVVIVTARSGVADAMRAARLSAVLTSQESFESIDVAVEALLHGRVSP